MDVFCFFLSKVLGGCRSCLSLGPLPPCLMVFMGGPLQKQGNLYLIAIYEWDHPIWYKGPIISLWTLKTYGNSNGNYMMHWRRIQTQKSVTLITFTLRQKSFQPQQETLWSGCTDFVHIISSLPSSHMWGVCADLMVLMVKKWWYFFC